MVSGEHLRCKCDGGRCGSVIAERVAPCAEFPAGAVKITSRHHGRPHINYLVSKGGAVVVKEGEGDARRG
jgi:hypothetical protein